MKDTERQDAKSPTAKTMELQHTCTRVTLSVGCTDIDTSIGISADTEQLHEYLYSCKRSECLTQYLGQSGVIGAVGGG